MKHAYLILAHNEFALLNLLIQALDDPRNDIFIHFDKKVNPLPALHTAFAKLSLLKNRVSIYWGDVSVVEGEYALFEEAVKTGPYAYYHLLSGVDMPLRSQEEIHAFFQAHQGKEFIGFSQGDIRKQVDRKVHRYHLYPKHFREEGGGMPFLRKAIRSAALEFQGLMGIRRNQALDFKKGTQWVSITQDFVQYVLQQKEQVLNTYARTFCSDEIYLQTLCWHSKFKDRIFDAHDEERGSQRKIGWMQGELRPWGEEDFEALMQSEVLFARKFTGQDLGVVQRLLKQLKKGDAKN